MGPLNAPATPQVCAEYKRKIMKAIHPKIVGVLTDTFKVPPAEIHPESTMDSLEMDSLAVAEFAVIIKEKLGVDAGSDRLYKDATLADITRFIDETVGGVATVSGEAAMSNPR
jgi:acyl carrier protein